MKNRLKNKNYNTPQNKEKQSWHEELWEWISKITRWTCDALFNTLAATWELTKAWTSKIAEKMWNKNPDIKSYRKDISKHHIEQAKFAWETALKWIWKTINWWYHTAKWAIRTIFSSSKNSIKDTIQWLREDHSQNKQDNKQENKQNNKQNDKQNN